MITAHIQLICPVQQTAQEAVYPMKIAHLIMLYVIYKKCIKASKYNYNSINITIIQGIRNVVYYS